MTMYPRFEVEAIEPIELAGTPEVLASELMSPFAWRSLDGILHVLIRVVPPGGSSDHVTGRIFYGTIDPDGLRFCIDDQPTLSPGPGPRDIAGCEDPTWVPLEPDCLVYYTGLDEHGDGQMLIARGPNPRELTKLGVALASSKTQRNTKEATVDRMADGRWGLFYEYSHEWRSKIGLAFGPGPHGPWDEQADPIVAREGAWDCWHLSTGPLLMHDPRAPVMFYNGSDQAPHWGIGWVVFAPDCATVVDRCIEPLIGSPEKVWHGRDYSFAASAIARDDGRIWLYFSRNDRKLFRATVRRNF